MELAQRGLALGAYVSFSGILTYKSAENLRVVAAEVPMDRLLVETDSPYLAPVPHRGKSNEPAFVVKTLEQLAAVKGVTPEDMAKATNDNFFRLFSKVPRPARLCMTRDADHIWAAAHPAAFRASAAIGACAIPPIPRTGAGAVPSCWRKPKLPAQRAC